LLNLTLIADHLPIIFDIKNIPTSNCQVFEGSKLRS